jgi:hypothetical protein
MVHLFAGNAPRRRTPRRYRAAATSGIDRLGKFALLAVMADERGGPKDGLGGKAGFAAGLAFLMCLLLAGLYFAATLPPKPEAAPHKTASSAPKTP